MSSEPVNRRDVAAKATYDALLAAARTAFGKRGYEGVSLAQIARDARATTGALYHHFADKRGLFAAVAESIEADLVAHLMRSTPSSADLWDVVTYAVTESLTYATRPGVANVIFREAPNVLGAAAWREIEMRYGFGQLCALLQSLSAAGRLGEYDPQIVAAIILGASAQTVDAIVTSPTPSETLVAGQTALRALLKTFRADVASS